MPSTHHPSQPSALTAGWLRSEPGLHMLADIQRGALPEMTRVFGQYGLYLRPSESIPADLQGNMLSKMLSLHRDRDALAGELRCLDCELPVSTGSLSLVYALFALESSPDPSALLQEIARSLKPEGSALLIGLNPWSLAQLRWLKPPGYTSASRLERLALDAGLEVVRRQYLGPFWPSADAANSERTASGWLDGFRAASLTVMRRREAALTPLRKAATAVSLRPGMSAG